MASHDGRVVFLKTITISPYTATDEQEEEIRRDSLARHGIPYAKAERSVWETLVADDQEPSLNRVVTPYEVMAVW